MLEIEIHHGKAEDANLIADLIKKMVVEMENYGGDSVNTAPDVWDSMELDIRAKSTRQDYIYLLAIHPSSTPTVVGMAAANIESLEDIFVSRKRLHIGAIYTVPHARSQGVAKQLLAYLLKWGQQMSVHEVDLNVLVANPARYLYEQCGFEPHEISMTRKLQRDYPG
jgi:GNAT superfamily N-acetyltransferase